MSSGVRAWRAVIVVPYSLDMVRSMSSHLRLYDSTANWTLDYSAATAWVDYVSDTTPLQQSIFGYTAEYLKPLTDQGITTLGQLATLDSRVVRVSEPCVMFNPNWFDLGHAWLIACVTIFVGDSDQSKHEHDRSMRRQAAHAKHQ